MTRKHFVAIAAILQGANEELVDSFCDYFETVNPHFDREKFIEACR